MGVIESGLRREDPPAALPDRSPLPADAEALEPNRLAVAGLDAADGLRLAAAVQDLALARGLRDVIDVVRRVGRRLMGADGVTFVLNDHGQCYYAEEDAIGPLWKGRRFPAESCISGWAMSHREAVSIPDIYLDPRIPVDAYRPTFVKSLAMAPVRKRDPIAAIGAYWAAFHAPSERDMALLQALADSCAVALANAELRDQTEQTAAELRMTEERLRLALDAGAIGTWDWDPIAGRMLWDARCKRVFGLRPEAQVSYEVFLAAIHPDDRERTDGVVQGAIRGEHGGQYSTEFRTIGLQDGLERWVSARGRVIFDEEGRARRFVGTVVDVTERKRAEQALREAEAGLREANRRKDEFMAVLSHELRNPLAPIRNALSVLERATAGSEQERRARAIIDRQSAHLARLVDDLLDVTRIARGKVQLRPERLELNEAVARAVEDHRAMFTKGDIQLDLIHSDEPVWIDADPTRLAQVVGNLLQNAAKFTPPGGRTVVSVDAEAQEGRALLRVRDSGPGIPEELLPRLFQPFAQADRTLDRSKGGLGLGLALVRGLVELHGGEVEARAAPSGSGAELVVRLPLQVGARAQRVESETASAKGRRVLVIEDNLDAADTLREVLEMCEHRVEVAYNGLQGLEKARRSVPDVVLCDIGLPGMTGYEVARAIRADERLRSVFLVALTGYALPEDQRKAAAAGFNVHLAKPPKVELIERAIAMAGR